ncbi:Transcriptional regulator, TetR family [[Actinomadura] parvosata subsp. kistnae]|uniref:TetR family transcriptional regulator n=1 Tax=[Actinomadura] parvosata subsp. kistnae TaxID=1909395 RepID=A0A1U9ZTH6_9ACTN|nr:TetR family transcriptional regulator [Nonomuraea sp. ATCC 55076]AQZ61255.1 TetR family transcriptional regulator [Nonomuraea sp. ATCC 55076]SPL97896.1 Transcriptional regulator, TetR family [Actinomadura parvosata subsp. kistnae]
MNIRTRRRDEQVSATREALLAAAERLFAERGVHAVGNRQISEAAGQGNNAAVTYHFGTKADLIRAISRRHAERIEAIRERMMAGIAGSTDLRDWVACLVRPFTEHLETLEAAGGPTWYARFTAQVMADPAFSAIMVDEAVSAAPALRTYREGLTRCLPGLPDELHSERFAMARHLIVQMCVERERALAEGAPTFRPTWASTADGLIEAILALWQAPAGP